MKVHICDFCKTIINNPMDRNVVKVKKRTPSIDFATGWREDYFWNNKYTLCPQCYERMNKFIVDAAPVDIRSRPKSAPKKHLTNLARMKRAKSAEEMEEIMAAPYINKKHASEFTRNLLVKGLLDWLEAEVKE